MAVGFLMSIKKNNIDIENKNIAILGAGGAARTIAMQFAKTEKVNQIIILNRNIERANDICNLVKDNLKVEILCDKISRLEEYTKDANVVINTTPLGMYGMDENFEDFAFLEKMKNGTVIDLIYNPKETKLLQEAKKLELKTLNGLDMLIFQALLADEIYLGKHLNLHELYEIVKRIDLYGTGSHVELLNL